jgi:hypothetical protein
VTSVYQGLFSPRQEERPWVRGWHIIRTSTFYLWVRGLDSRCGNSWHLLHEKSQLTLYRKSWVFSGYTPLTGLVGTSPTSWPFHRSCSAPWSDMSHKVAVSEVSFESLRLDQVELHPSESSLAFSCKSGWLAHQYSICWGGGINDHTYTYLLKQYLNEYEAWMYYVYSYQCMHRQYFSTQKQLTCMYLELGYTELSLSQKKFRKKLFMKTIINAVLEYVPCL